MNAKRNKEGNKTVRKKGRKKEGMNARNKEGNKTVRKKGRKEEGINARKKLRNTPKYKCSCCDDSAAIYKYVHTKTVPADVSF
jgi:hypothetical protein